MTRRTFLAALCLGCSLVLSLGGCGALVPLAIVAIQTAPAVIEELEQQHVSAAQHSEPPVAPTPAPAARAARDDVPLLEPDDVAP